MKKIFAYKLTLLCSVGIAVMSLVSFSTAHLPRVPYADKLVHACMYAILTAILLYEMPHYSWKMLFCAIAYASVLGAVLELVQEYCTATRSGDWLDWLADVLGACVVCGGVWLIKKIKQTK